MRLGRYSLRALTPRRSVWVRLGILALLLLFLSPTALLAEDDDGGGQAAGAVLQGIAANIQAAAPIAIAGVQSAADVQIARDTAGANVKMTEISADTTKYLADRQADIALAQAQTAQEINQINQDGMTRRLEDELSEVRAARLDDLAAEQKKMLYEKQLNDERIALAKKQAADNFKLAQMTLNAQLTQAGLSSGFNNIDSGSRLAVSRVLSGSSMAVARPTRMGATLRLMASIQPAASDRRPASPMRGRKGRRARGAIGAIGARLAALLTNHVAAGSFRMVRHKIEQEIATVRTTAPLSDLATFHAAVQARRPVFQAAELYAPAESGYRVVSPAGGHSSSLTTGGRSGHAPYRGTASFFSR